MNNCSHCGGHKDEADPCDDCIAGKNNYLNNFYGEE